MKIIFLGTALWLIMFTGLVSANLLEAVKAVEEAQCKKLATAYANDPSASTVHTIAQLQICLAQTLQGTTSHAIPRNFDIQPPRPSTNNVDSMLPRLPTPPTPPSAIKIR